jgi:co-chaperonin GroES (HSP10)
MNLPDLEECKPGIRATGFALIVALPPDDDFATINGRKTSLLLPDQVKDRERMAEVRGRIVSISPAAFDFADFGGEAPKEGQIIVFARHVGIVTQGEDGREYRILQDRDCWGIVDEPER